MRDEVSRLWGPDTRLIPPGPDGDTVPGLPTEARERLTGVRPRSLGQASRIPRLTPAAVSIWSVWCHRVQAKAPEAAPAG